MNGSSEEKAFDCWRFSIRNNDAIPRQFDFQFMYRSRHLNVGWNRDAIAAISDGFADSLKKQDQTEQRPHKISYHFRSTDTSEHAQVLKQLESRIKASGFSVKVIYASNKCVDILPDRAGKGSAVAWLIGKRCFDSAVLCGDSGNDIGRHWFYFHFF